MEFMCVPYATFLICLHTKMSLSRISSRTAILSKTEKTSDLCVNTKSIGRPLTSDPLPRHSAIRRLASNGNTYLAARGVDAIYILSTSVFSSIKSPIRTLVYLSGGYRGYFCYMGERAQLPWIRQTFIDIFAKFQIPIDPSENLT